jgi:ABC-type transport system involved in multi-copper enzyme maturation permease subunit
MLISEAGFSANEILPDSPETDGWQLIVDSMNFAMHIFAPLIIAMMASDTLSSEAANGTLTLTLSKPIRRDVYLFKKIGSQAILTLIFFLIFALIAFLAGFIIGYDTFYGAKAYGPTSTSVIIPRSEIWWRMILFFFLAAFGSFIVALIGISISTFTNSGTSVTAITFIFYMITEILGGALNSDFVKYLLSPAIKKMIWSLLFETVQWDAIRDSIAILSIYAISFLSIALLQFNRKDIQ